jgi:hypothetical protein
MVINTYYSYLLLHCTGCDNITSFFEMRTIYIYSDCNGAGVVSFGSRGPVVLKICSLSLSAAIMRWKHGGSINRREHYLKKAEMPRKCALP